MSKAPLTLLSLLCHRNFLPLFVTQFLGAFNGNLFKNATVILILYRLASQGAAGGKVLATVAVGLFVLPFFLFSATAGQLADRFDKARMIRLSKLFEVAVALVAALALGLAQPSLLLAGIFLLGAQAALFGPLKYGILPDHLGNEQLLAANGLVEAGTFVAILAGTMMGSLTALAEHGILILQLSVVGAALAGWAASLAIPPAEPKAPGLAISLDIIGETWRLLKDAAATPDLFGAMIGISWFWLVGATYLTQFPAFAKDALHAGPTVVTVFLVMFTLGISIGSLACQRLLKGRASLRFGALGALGMALFGMDFVLAAQPLAPNAAALAEATALLHQSWTWRLLADLLLTSIAAGLYVVPLYTVLQQRAEPGHRARIIAANNVLNALFMTAAAGVAAILLGAGLTIQGLLFGTAAANVLVAGLAHRQAKRVG